jgi:hypothetical protein
VGPQKKSKANILFVMGAEQSQQEANGGKSSDIFSESWPKDLMLNPTLDLHLFHKKKSKKSSRQSQSGIFSQGKSCDIRKNPIKQSHDEKNDR